MEVNERFIWATDILGLQPSENVLEVGCGAGILVEQMANKLLKGTITAIDRSESMIRMASKRNAGFVSSGKVKFVVAEFSGAILKKSSFHKVVAFNVNFFWKNPEKELDIIRQSLKREGRLYVFYQAPHDITVKAAEPISEKLKKFSYHIDDIIFKKMKPASAFGILAKPI